ncbi:uncharacterized protein Dsimw501_GD27923, isoform B [Drosophila simulans]|nr:uncharacterized protein Dsimw501_GD27923, isoform A [Drosophila simulans]KMZ07762.1 uncharacterized protein Dsimw501_GD27923, isoform B [Drosophila simulans]
MPPLQRDQLNHQQFVHHYLQSQPVNNKIDSFDIKHIRKTLNPTTNPKVRTEDRFKTSSKSKITNPKSGNTQLHFHLSETPELSASTSLLPSAFVASSAALVNVTCQAEEGQSSAGSHYTVHRGNDAGISFAALDFRFIRHTSPASPLSVYGSAALSFYLPHGVGFS